MISEVENRLYIDVIRKIVSESPHHTAKQIIDAAVRDLYAKFVHESDRRLIKLAFRSHMQQKDLDLFLTKWDIESAGADRAAILAYTMKMHPNLKFDDYTGPRLKGLLNYLRFQNLELICHFSKIVRTLNQQGIVPMLIKGGAMRYMRPDLPRVMGDMDVLVFSKKAFEAAKNTVVKMGYDFWNAGHSLDIHLKDNFEKGILDIHKFFVFLPGFNASLNKKLLSRAEKHQIFSVDAYLPSNEDMVFICLNNLTHNLKNNSCAKGIPYVLFDLVYLINSKTDFNWDIVAEDIVLSKTTASSYVAMRFIDQILPGIFPKKMFSNFVLNKEVEDLINKDKFYALYVHDVKYACKKLKFQKAIRDWASFKDYLKVKVQHFFTKRIMKHPLLIRCFFNLNRSKNAD